MCVVVHKKHRMDVLTRSKTWFSSPPVFLTLAWNQNRIYRFQQALQLSKFMSWHQYGHQRCLSYGKSGVRGRDLECSSWFILNIRIYCWHKLILLMWIYFSWFRITLLWNIIFTSNLTQLSKHPLHIYKHYKFHWTVNLTPQRKLFVKKKKKARHRPSIFWSLSF